VVAGGLRDPRSGGFRPDVVAKSPSAASLSPNASLVPGVKNPGASAQGTGTLSASQAASIRSNSAGFIYCRIRERERTSGSGTSRQEPEAERGLKLAKES